jgi:hypothetical protein
MLLTSGEGEGGGREEGEEEGGRGGEWREEFSLEEL